MAEKKDIRCAWISGSRKECREVLRNISEAYGECERVMVGVDTPLSELERRVSECDCFSPKRLIVVSAIPKSDIPKATVTSRIKKIITSIPDDCLMIFYGIDSDSEKALSAHVSKLGKMFDFPLWIPTLEAEAHLIKCFGEHEIVVQKEVCLQLIRTFPANDRKLYSVDQLDNSAEKIVLYLGKRKELKADDVQELSTAMDFATIWQVFDAIDDKDFLRAMRRMRELISFETNGDPKAICERFFTTSLWQYRILLLASDGMAKEIQIPAIREFLLSLKKMSTAGSGGWLVHGEEQAYSEKKVQMLLNGNSFAGNILEKYTRRRLANIVSFIQKSMAVVRYIDSPAMNQTLIDLFLIVACESMDDKRVARLSNSLFSIGSL